MLLKAELDKEVVKGRDVDQNLQGHSQQLPKAGCWQLNVKVSFFDFDLLDDGLTLAWLFLS